MARGPTQPARATAHCAKSKLGIPKVWTKEISSSYSCLPLLLTFSRPEWSLPVAKTQLPQS